MTIARHDLHKITHSAGGRHVVKLIHRSTGKWAQSDPHDHRADAEREALERLEAELAA